MEKSESTALVEVAREGEYLGKAKPEHFPRYVNMPAVVEPKKEPKKKAGRRAKGGWRRYVTPQGRVRFQAQLRGLVNGVKVPSMSFDTQDEAEKYIARMLVEAKPAVEVQQATPGDMLMPDLFRAYVQQRIDEANPVSESMRMLFDRLSAHPLLAPVRVDEINFTHVRAYCAARKSGQYNEGGAGVHISTIQSEFARITLALTAVGAANGWGLRNDKGQVVGPFDPLNGARKELRKLKLISDSRTRDRRPSDAELDLLRWFFAEQEAMIKAGKKRSRGRWVDAKGIARVAIPMVDILNVAVCNAFRRGELVRLERGGIKFIDDGFAIELSRKDCTEENGRRDDLVPVALDVKEILERQPVVHGASKLYFPFKADTISQRFTDACRRLRKLVTTDPRYAQLLEAQPKIFLNLRFHDMRREAISNMVDVVGREAAKAVSGHQTDIHFDTYVDKKKEAGKISVKLPGLTLRELVAA